MSSRYVTALLGTLLLTSGLAQTAGTSPERELLERIVNPAYSAPFKVEAEILLQKLPADLGVSLPAGSRVIGSVVNRSSDSDFPSGVNVYFDTALTPEQTNEFLKRSLTAADWKTFPVPRPYGQGGFQGSDALGEINRYYRLNPPEILSFMTQVTAGVTQVTLVKNESNDIERQLRFSEDPYFNEATSLPKLTAPAGIAISLRGTGSSGNDVKQEATMTGDLSRKALFTHYAEQLRQAGWTPLNRAETATITSGLWSFKPAGKDREQIGQLIIREESAGQYRAVLGTQSFE